MVDRKNASTAGKARGILKTPPAQGAFHHARILPSPELCPWIQHYWLVEWKLDASQQQTIETLPHPNVHLVFSSEDGTALVHGVQTRKFQLLLKGHARVFGVKFQAGGFYAFLNAPVSSLRGKTIEATRVFGDAISSLQPVLSGDAAEASRIEEANRFFSHLIPDSDPDALTASQIVESILNNPQIRNVEALSSNSGLSVRSLQRLFQRYVGVSPKWVISRYRMHELVELLNRGEEVDWATRALEMGYFDQSHLIRDFRRTTGWSPEKYRLRFFEQQARY